MVVFHVARGTVESPGVRGAIVALLNRIGTLAHVSRCPQPLFADRRRSGVR